MRKLLQRTGRGNLASCLVIAAAAAVASCDSSIVPGTARHVAQSAGGPEHPVAHKIAELRESDVWGLDMSPDGRFVAADAPMTNEIHVWDWRAGQVVRALQKKGQGTFWETIGAGLRFSPDGRYLIGAPPLGADRYSKSFLGVWRVDSWNVVSEFSEPYMGGLDGRIAFTPDGQSLVRTAGRPPQSSEPELMVYSTASWSPVWSLRTAPFQPAALALRSDGHVAALGGGRYEPNGELHSEIVIIDLDGRAAIRTIDAFPRDTKVVRLAWSSDGAYLAAGAERDAEVVNPPSPPFPESVKIFDTATWKEVAAEARASSEDVRALGYTPDGKYFVEAGVAHKVRIWDARHRALLQEIEIDANALALSKDSHQLAVAGPKSITIWTLD